MPKGKKLPGEIKRLLWEYRDDLDHQEDASIIIEKVLDHGSRDNIAWLFENYPREKICQVVQSSPRLDPKTATYWALKLDLAEKPRCTKTRSPQKPNKVWRY